MQMSALDSHQHCNSTKQCCASGRERGAGRLYESGYKKRMKKESTVLDWCSIFQ